MKRPGKSSKGRRDRTQRHSASHDAADQTAPLHFPASQDMMHPGSTLEGMTHLNFTPELIQKLLEIRIDAVTSQTLALADPILTIYEDVIGSHIGLDASGECRLSAKDRRRCEKRLVTRQAMKILDAIWRLSRFVDPETRNSVGIPKDLTGLDPNGLTRQSLTLRFKTRRQSPKAAERAISRIADSAIEAGYFFQLEIRDNYKPLQATALLNTAFREIGRLAKPISVRAFGRED